MIYLIKYIKMNTYKNCVRNTLIALLGSAMLFAACEKEEEKESKSSACEIVSFSVNDVAWDVGDSTIIHIYPSETTETSLTPTITLSPGATVSPLSGVAQNFFATGGVKYTVTAEDGVTTKTYIAKATRTSSATGTACDIVSFSVDDVAWEVGDSTITHIYPSETNVTDLTPTITLSPEATINPPANEAQNFFTEQGVRYTVTAEDGVTTKTYTVKASIETIASGTTGDCTWTLTGVAGNYTLTVSGSGVMGDYDYDSSPPWQQYKSDIITAIIQDGVVNTGNYAFNRCDKLTSVSIGNSVTSIGDNAFDGCIGLTSITIPNSVISIGVGAFASCIGLTSITIPNSVISIGVGAFAICSGLTFVTIPNSVTSIGEVAFYDCSSLTSVTIPNSVTSIGDRAFFGCRGLTSVTIPNSVIEIGSGAFAGCSGLTSVIIPNSVTEIGGEAFRNCSSLPSVTIPNSVTSIGESAFHGCSSLTSVTIPNSVTSIGVAAFGNCSGLTSINVDADNPNYISEDGVIFNKDKTMLITCPSRKTGSYIIPNSVTSIGEVAFYGCSGLTSVTIPNSVTEIHRATFAGCSGLTSITIPNSVTYIDNYAFYGCSGLTSVTIPNSVTEIGGGAFEGCNGLTSVTIPNSVTSIGWYAFADCSGLTEITNLNPVPQNIEGYVFLDVNKSAITLRVPSGSVDAYKEAAVWSEFGNIVGI
jgi:hypothetical protein